MLTLLRIKVQLKETIYRYSLLSTILDAIKFFVELPDANVLRPPIRVKHNITLLRILELELLRKFKLEFKSQMF